jgi:hypothetical protein
VAKSINLSLPKYQPKSGEAKSAAIPFISEARPLPGTVHLEKVMLDQSFKLGGKTTEPFVFLLELTHQEIDVHK